MSYTGWELPPEERARLLGVFAPTYPDVVAHHITLRLGGKPDVLPEATTATVIGVTDDGVGLEALIVEIAGTTERPDGKTYHITWSVDRAAGFAPKMAAGLINTHGWRAVEPTDINISPRFFAQ